MRPEDFPREAVWNVLQSVLLEEPKPSAFFEELRRMGALEPWFSELHELIGVEQDPEFHPEGDVWVHTMMVADRCADLRSETKYPLILMLSSLSHDFGKKTTTSLQKGKIHAYGHETAGMEPARNFIYRLTNDPLLIEAVVSLVRLHMNPNQLVRQNAAQKAYMKMFDQTKYPEELLLLCKADHLSRGLDEAYADQENILRNHLVSYHELMNTPEVTREDFLKAGFLPGPQMEEALVFTHKAHLAGVPRGEALTCGITRLKQLLKETKKKEKKESFF